MSGFDPKRTLRLHSTIGSIQEVSGRLKDFPRERRHGLRHHRSWARPPHVRYQGVSSIGQCNTSCSLLAGVSKAKVFRGR